MNHQFWCAENICTFYLYKALFVQKETQRNNLHHGSQLQENSVLTDILGS
jgi:hypothetical protein